MVEIRSVICADMLRVEPTVEVPSFQLLDEAENFRLLPWDLLGALKAEVLKNKDPEGMVIAACEIDSGGDRVSLIHSTLSFEVLPESWTIESCLAKGALVLLPACPYLIGDVAMEERSGARGCLWRLHDYVFFSFGLESGTWLATDVLRFYPQLVLLDVLPVSTRPMLNKLTTKKLKDMLTRRASPRNALWNEKI